LVAVRKRRAAPRCLGVGPGGTKRLRRLARAIFKSSGKAAALRYSPPPARKKAKAFFRLTAPASAPFLDDAPKAAQRRPPLALGTASLEGRKETNITFRDNVSQQRLAQRRRQLRRRPKNGAGPGLLSEKTL